MSPIRKQIDEMLDRIPEADQAVIFEVIKRFVPDDAATADDLDAIRESRAEYENGETVNHDAVNWD